MAAEAHGYLSRQFDTAWRLASLHLNGLATEECMVLDYSFGTGQLARDDVTWPGDVVAWVNMELMKNAAEIGYARFLHAVSP